MEIPSALKIMLFIVGDVFFGFLLFFLIQEELHGLRRLSEIISESEYESENARLSVERVPQ
jgi:predicted transglutaminase-like protease